MRLLLSVLWFNERTRFQEDAGQQVASMTEPMTTLIHDFRGARSVFVDSETDNLIDIP